MLLIAVLREQSRGGRPCYRCPHRYISVAVHGMTFSLVHILGFNERERERERETETETETETDRQTDRDRETEIERERREGVDSSDTSKSKPSDI